MRNKVCFLIILLVFVFYESVFAEDDWQSWNGFSVKKKLNETVNLIWLPSLRLKDDVSEVFYWESNQGLLFNINEHLDIATQYRFNTTQKTNGDWIKEHRVELEPTVKWKMGDFQFSDRNRIAYRIVDGKEKWRYRNRIKLGKTVSMKNIEITPFASNEFFYDFDQNKYNQNRAAAGFSKKITKNAGLEIYYMYQSIKSGENWHGVNIIGTTISFSL